MPPRLKKIIKGLLWFAVLAAALAYLVVRVDLEDHVILADGKTKLTAYATQIVDGRERVEVERKGQRVWIDEGELLRPKAVVEGQTAPLIFPGLKKVVRDVNWRYIWYALLIFAPNYVFLAWRLRLMLRTQGVILRRRDAVKVSYASAFLNFAVPTGSTGGDIYKAYYVSAHATGRRTEAITVVLLDRAVGLINFIFMAAVVTALSALSGRLGPLGRFVGGGFAVCVLACCAYFSNHVRRLIRIDDWLPRVPKIGEHLARIDRTAFSMRQHPRLLVIAFAWTMVVQTVVCISVMFLANAIHMTCDLNYGHVLDYFLAIIVGLTVSALPGNPPQGAGVLEAIMSQVLVRQGYGTFNQVFAICLGLRLLHLIWALPGVLVLLIDPKPPNVRSLADAAAGDDDSPDAAPRA